MNKEHALLKAFCKPRTNRKIECPINRILSSICLCYVLLFAVFTGGCEKNGDKDERKVVVGLEANPQVLDPRIAQDAYSLRILPLVFEGLFRIDENSGPGPKLVKSFERKDDTTFVFRIKEGRKFADGTLLTADDVVYTLKSQADPELHSRREIIMEKISELKKTGKYEVSMKLKEPYAPLFSELTMGIVPKKEASKKGRKFSRAAFGTGPFQVESFEPGREVVLVRNPHYAGEEVWFEKIVFRVIPDGGTRVMALERGEVHLLQNSVLPDDLPLLKKSDDIKVSVEPGSNCNYLGFNLEDPILQNRDVRRAIAYAIDREKIADMLLKDTVTLARSILPPHHWAYNKDVPVYDYDPQKAKELLDKAGHIDPDGDGPDHRFKLVYKTSQNKARRWMAEAIAAQLEKVGIKTDVRSYEFGAFFADISEGNFQLYSLSWVGLTDPDIYYVIFHSDNFPPGGMNRNRYNNEELDTLLEEGRASLNRERRKEIYMKVQEIVCRDLPTYNLWYTNNVIARHKNLIGFKTYPGGDYRSLVSTKME